MGVEVLLADDDCEVRRILAEAFRKRGVQITEASSDDGLLDELRAHAFDLIVSDVRMPGMTGIAALRVMERHDTPVILITAFGDEETRSEAASLGATLFSKPFDIDELLAFAMPLTQGAHHADPRSPSR